MEKEKVMDLIDRQAAIDALDYGNRWEHMDMTLIDRDDAKGQIEHLPSAQPELVEKAAYIRGFEQGRTQGMIDAQDRKKGKWIKFIPINDGHLWFCDQCGAKLYCDDSKKYPEDNFCCKCGAGMRGGEDGRSNQQTGSY